MWGCDNHYYHISNDYNYGWNYYHNYHDTNDYNDDYATPCSHWPNRRGCVVPPSRVGGLLTTYQGHI
jgi:hypothetical protein